MKRLRQWLPASFFLAYVHLAFTLTPLRPLASLPPAYLSRGGSILGPDAPGVNDVARQPTIERRQPRASYRACEVHFQAQCAAELEAYASHKDGLCTLSAALDGQCCSLLLGFVRCAIPEILQADQICDNEARETFLVYLQIYSLICRSDEFPTDPSSWSTITCSSALEDKCRSLVDDLVVPSCGQDAWESLQKTTSGLTDLCCQSTIQATTCYSTCAESNKHCTDTAIAQVALDMSAKANAFCSLSQDEGPEDPVDPNDDGGPEVEQASGDDYGELDTYDVSESDDPDIDQTTGSFPTTSTEAMSSPTPTTALEPDATPAESADLNEGTINNSTQLPSPSNSPLPGLFSAGPLDHSADPGSPDAESDGPSSSPATMGTASAGPSFNTLRPSETPQVSAQPSNTPLDDTDELPDSIDGQPSGCSDIFSSSECLVPSVADDSLLDPLADNCPAALESYRCILASIDLEPQCPESNIDTVEQALVLVRTACVTDSEEVPQASWDRPDSIEDCMLQLVDAPCHTNPESNRPSWPNTQSLENLNAASCNSTIRLYTCYMSYVDRLSPCSNTLQESLDSLSELCALIDPNLGPSPPATVESGVPSPPTDIPPSFSATPGFALPSQSPTEPEEPNGSACFPASSTVELGSGRKKRMDELILGDTVLSGHKRYSRVFFFSHREKTGLHDFLELRTSNATIELSPDHYVVVNGGLRAARHVRVSDTLILGNDVEATVERVRRIRRRGVFNPHTEDGKLVVDGIQASCYTRHVHPWLAQTLLRPVRAMSKLGISFDDTRIHLFRRFTVQGPLDLRANQWTLW